MTTFWIEMTECNQHFTTFRVWRNRDLRFVEFRGDSMTAGWLNPEDWGNMRPTDAQLLHDGLEGWHTCVMHAGDRVAVTDRHSDFEFIRNMFELG
jgi:hypothetical protein